MRDDCSPDETRWLGHLGRLLRFATHDEQAELQLTDDPGYPDGVTTVQAAWGRSPAHPQVTVHTRLSRAQQEATVRHEAAAWLRGDVVSEMHRAALEADWAAGVDHARSADEEAADDYALNVLLADEQIRAELCEPLEDVRRDLIEDKDTTPNPAVTSLRAADPPMGVPASCTSPMFGRTKSRRCVHVPDE